jgi:hypothetical protein
MRNTKKKQSKISIMLILAFMWTALSCPLSVKSDPNDDPYTFFINNEVIKAGFKATNENGCKVSMEAYYQYGLLVYGTPKDVKKKGIPKGFQKQETDENGEWRYLGYNYGGEPVTNEKFKDEREMKDGETYRDWIPHSVNVNGAETSWYNLKGIFKDDEEGILKKKNWTREWKRHGEYVGISASDFGSESKVQLLSPATLFSDGAVKIKHKAGGTTYYCTFTVPKLIENGKLDGAIETVQNATIKENKNSVDVPISVWTEITGTKLIPPKLITGLTARVMKYKIGKTGEWVEMDLSQCGASKSGVFKVSDSGTITFSRDMFPKGHQHIVTFKGYASFASALSDEDRRIELEKKVSINIEDPISKPVAYITGPDTLYVGEIGEIIGDGQDDRYPKFLSYHWQCPKGVPVSGTGGDVSFDEKGKYTFSLIVSNVKGEESERVFHTVKVINPGQTIIELNADNEPKTKVITTNNGIILEKDKTKTITIDAHGTVKGLEQTNKKVKRLNLSIIGATDRSFRNTNTSIQTKTASNVDNIDHVFTFNIDISELAKKNITEFTQYFKVRLKATYSDGTVQYSEDEILKTVYSKDNIQSPKPKPEPPTNLNPCAYIKCKSKVKQGSDFRVRGRATDPDDPVEELSLEWTTGIDGYGSGGLDENTRGKLKDYGDGKGGGTIWFRTPGKEVVTLRASDPYGGANCEDKVVTVLPSRPTPSLTITGKRKVNRKLLVNVKDSGGCSKRFPVDWKKTQWVIRPYNNSSATLDDIKTTTTSSTKREGGKNNKFINGDYRDLNLLFKKPGQYYVKVTLFSTSGYSRTDERILVIDPDLPPKVNFMVPDRIIRDPKDNNYATAVIVDTSTSPDGDEIGRRIWFHCFDSDNDGNYKEEKWYVLDNNTWQPVTNKKYGISGSHSSLRNINLGTVKDENRTRIEIKKNHVGRITVELMIVEDIGDTIPQFINESDYLKDSTFDL